MKWLEFKRILNDANIDDVEFLRDWRGCQKRTHPSSMSFGFDEVFEKYTAASAVIIDAFLWDESKQQVNWSNVCEKLSDLEKRTDGDDDCG